MNIFGEDETGNTNACALWINTAQGWKLVDFSFGHSDAFYIISPMQYGAAKEIF